MLQLTFASAPYDRTRPLLDGRASFVGISLRTITQHPEVSFQDARSAKFDLTELSLSGYVSAYDTKSSPYVALPVFLSRAFRHSGIYISTRRGIRTPADLRGKTIGTPDYKTTANVWIRAFLTHDHGVHPHEMHWIEAPMENGEHASVSSTSVSGVEITAMPGSDLSSMLARGEIDAVIGAKRPSCFRPGQDSVARLFPDYQSAEQDYFHRTGLFPIMHLLGLRRELHESHPWLAAEVCRGFEAARRIALQDLEEICQLTAMLPWAALEHERTVHIMGADYWPYGIRANRHVLQAFASYHFQQGLSRTLHEPTTWFVPSVDIFD